MDTRIILYNMIVEDERTIYSGVFDYFYDHLDNDPTGGFGRFLERKIHFSASQEQGACWTSRCCAMASRAFRPFGDVSRHP
ncbi:hypothetical protein MTR_2g027290 [Medicago truncatula]|uniref:Uncharacterized protein n=1 Tax=Medicago truncatula TaxID=3880 RepID=G7IQ35_MEDTR|nr:hypothetical protein MTR_2g027290 [Medicago truncatula]